MNKQVTNLSELAYCFSTNQHQQQRVIGVPSMLPGESVEQAIQRRAKNAKRIDEKLAEKKEKKMNAYELNEARAQDRWSELNDAQKVAATAAHIKKVVDYLNSELGAVSAQVNIVNLGACTVYRNGTVHGVRHGEVDYRMVCSNTISNTIKE